MKFFALLCNLARWCWWWQLRFTKRTSNHLWWSWIASIWAEFGWATVCGRSHMHLRRLPTAFCFSPRLIIVADVQLLANPPCPRGNNDDRGGRGWSWRFGPNTVVFVSSTVILSLNSGRIAEGSERFPGLFFHASQLQFLTLCLFWWLFLF